MIDLIDALNDPSLFGPWFAGPSWQPWKAVLKAAHGHPLDDDEMTIFRQVAQRDPPSRPVRELWAVVGRRGGKDSVASVIGAHRAAFHDYTPYLRPGETASVISIATDREQARIALRYARAYFGEVEMMQSLIERETNNGFELTTNCDFSVLTNSFRAVRGRAYACAILSESAFYRSEESATPDTETYSAILPGMATIPNSLLLGISSPYRRSGLLYEKWRDHFGKPDDETLVVQGASRVFNPTLSKDFVDREMERDPAKARAEYLAEWRDDIASFVSRDVIEAAVDRNVVSRPPIPGVRYRAFADAASGSGGDSLCITIAHLEPDRATVCVDIAHEVRPPFSPHSAINDVCNILKAYGLHEVTGDRWAPGFVAEAFGKNEIKYKYSELDRSAIYLEALPALVSGRVRLPDNNRLVSQLASLERKTASSGKDRIDHPSGGSYHDDLANATCGAIWLTNAKRPMTISPEAVEISRRGMGLRAQMQRAAGIRPGGFN